MPFEIRKVGDKYCCFTQGAGGKNHGCHPTREEAVAQLRALYANVPEARHSQAQFAGTKPAEKDGAPKSPPKGYPSERDAYADPENWKYPLDTEAHVRAALAYWGKAANRADYSASEQAFIEDRIEAAADKFGIETEDSDEAGEKKDAKMAATFALPAGTEDGEHVLYANSLLFRSGDYPDQRFSATPADLAACLGAEVPLEIEHVPSVLDGKLGHAKATAVTEDGALKGEVRIPKWLDDVLGPEERKLSCVFNRDTGALLRVGIVRKGRVPDAAMMSAYFAATRHDTPAGQSRLQMIHDMAAEGGAVCTRGNTAQMASRHEASKIQQIHDIAAEGGAVCSSMKDGPGRYAMYAGTDDAQQGKGETKMPEDQGGQTPSWVQGFKTWLGFGNGDQPTAATAPGTPAGGDAAVRMSATPAAPPAPDPAQVAAMSAMDERVKRAEAALAEERQRRLRAEAAAFADQVVAAKKAVPAERDEIAAAYFAAATDDAENPREVAFGEADKKGTRTEQLRRLYEARTPHTLTEDLLKGADPKEVQALFSQATTRSGDAKLTAEQKEALLKLSPVGREVLASQKNGGGK